MLPNLRTYHRAKSISEALALLHKDSGTIVLLAGGTHLMRSRDPNVREVVDMRDLGLEYIKLSQGILRIGATTRIEQLVESPEVVNFGDGILATAARWSHPSKLIRNVATVGGDLVSSGPLSVLYTAFLVLQAQVRIAGGKEFALAMNIFLNKKGLGGGILTEVLVPALEPNTVCALMPLVVPYAPAPILCAACRLTFERGCVTDPKIAVSGLRPVPQRIQSVEWALEGEQLTERTILEAGDRVAKTIEPISDPYASSDYRREVSSFLVRKALEQCRDLAELSST